MATRFAAIPAVPQGSLTGASTVVLISSLKENVELLTGTRGEEDNASKALTFDQIKQQPIGEQSLFEVTAKGEGFTISNEQLAGLDDFGRLINDVQVLANDLAETRQALNNLIAQLNGFE